MGQLRIGQTHHMAPRLERARLILRPGCPRNFSNQVLGNKIANLVQDAELGSGWGSFEFIHPCRVAGERKKFQPIFSNPLGSLCPEFFSQLCCFSMSLGFITCGAIARGIRQPSDVA
jgi:hypothetical protein